MKYGLENILKAVYKGLLKKRESKKSIEEKVNKMLISKGLKLKLLDYIKDL